VENTSESSDLSGQPRRHGLPTSGGRRRPSGEAPPLPHVLGRTGKFWLVMIVYFTGVLIGVLIFPSVTKLFERFDALRLRWLVSLRTDWLTHPMLWINTLSSPWAIRLIRWGTILALISFKRWRQLWVFLGAVIFVEFFTYQTSLYMARPRPLDVTILGGWHGYSMPSQPLAGLAVSLVGAAYCLVVAGRSRYRTKWAIAVVVGLVAFARLYLAVDQPTSAAFGAIFGAAVALVAFRWFCPNDVFPVSYRRGKSAHLDVSGARGEAIIAAVGDQLGLEVLEIKPVGLEGSGGSTPLRLRVKGSGDQPDRYLFAKLYAKSHVRADRWYKLGRSILYGALEDETPFQTVRRFVEYEDYTLRLLKDYGISTPEPYGVVEITPEREYMIVMEFFEGAVEIGEAEIDDGVIDEGLQLIRLMWESGLAHRDVKPANLMVRDGRLLVIDVFFVQVRPSPWRQAVDLANMMMVLALRTDPDRVYRRALLVFSEDELSEAFAAARGVASPTQLRSMMKADGRGILERFRELAPARRPVSVQRWSVRRIALTAGVALLAFLAIGLVISNWTVFA
jgi:tRNA A-37 threonylcarbamoyl transferase component Bud32/membrane-associated phospholipid phosphatase